MDLTELLTPAIANAAEILLQCVMNDNKILACGNGSSASSAKHICTLLTSRFEQDRPGLASVPLTASASIITSIASHYGYDNVFARQVSALGQPGDVLMAFSASGNTASIVAAATAARDRNMTVIALTGSDGGMLTEQLEEDDVLICVPVECPARIQEIHLLTIHCLCDALDHALLGT